MIKVTANKLHYFVFIWFAIILILLAMPATFSIVFGVCGGQVEKIDEQTEWNYQMYLSPTQWAYPHLITPGLIVASGLTLGYGRNRLEQTLVRAMSGITLEVLWELIESNIAQFSIAGSTIALNESFVITEAKAYEISLNPSAPAFFRLIRTYREEQPDTIGDLLQAVIGSLVASITETYFSIAPKTQRSLWKKRRWWLKILYVVLIILSSYVTSLGILRLSFSAGCNLERFNVGFWLWFALSQGIYWFMYLLDLYVTRDDGILRDSTHKNWIFYLFPFTFLSHLAAVDLRIPAYFAVWGFCVIYLGYGAIQRYGSRTAIN